MMDRWDRFDKIISQVEQFALSFFLAVLILVAFSQIVLRNFWETGLSWGDPLARYLVLWIGFIGAALATKENKHISIDLFSQWVSSVGNTLIKLINHLFSTFISGLLAFAAFRFTQNEALFGGVSVFGIPAWIPLIILPIAFGLMTLRFGFRFLKIFFTILFTGANQDDTNSR
jgi:TRAP-type C4-dicarboxylate transport system permease small subunit|tara:strand:+ start:798 stop:1316 length:519 start_codon:yes stop_codon:yes gene_type:complete